MKIALKYGLLITLVVVAWVVIVRFGINPAHESKINLGAPLLFNVAAFFCIYFGIRERKRQLAGRFTFKEGIKTGAAISLVYATSACLFFLIQYLIAGPRLLMVEPGAQIRPLWQVALMAYIGLFFGALIFGLIYSALCAFVLAREQHAS
jgi:hypothetical protein